MGAYLRECPNALGRVPDVPHLDVGAGHRKHQPRVAAVFDRDHVVGVALESCDLLPRHQVPHLAATVCQRQGSDYEEEVMSVEGMGSSPKWEWEVMLSVESGRDVLECQV